MSPGLGAFLQRVDVVEKMVNGSFHGFQLLALYGDPEFWAGSDLQVGDVVTRVNGAPIGHYEEAFRVWQSLLNAGEIVVSYERNGQPREVRIVVHEDDEPYSDIVGDGSAAADPGSVPEPALPGSPSRSAEPGTRN